MSYNDNGKDIEFEMLRDFFKNPDNKYTVFELHQKYSTDKFIINKVIKEFLKNGIIIVNEKNIDNEKKHFYSFNEKYLKSDLKEFLIKSYGLNEFNYKSILEHESSLSSLIDKVNYPQGGHTPDKPQFNKDGKIETRTGLKNNDWNPDDN